MDAALESEGGALRVVGRAGLSGVGTMKELEAEIQYPQAE